MSHRCTNCGEIYEDGSSVILSGCKKCNGRKFEFISRRSSDQEEPNKQDTQDKDQKLPIIHPDEKIQSIIDRINEMDEDEVNKVIEQLKNGIDVEEDEEKTASIDIVERGSYNINLSSILEGNELVVCNKKRGQYMVDISNLLHKKKGK
jgi:hypothetical protein